MLCYCSEGVLWTIDQHDHGLLAGLLAEQWRLPSPLSPWLKLAITFHDYGWHLSDQSPLWDPNRKRPYDFLEYPMEVRLRLYQKSIDLLETLHPFVAYMTSWHYSTFPALQKQELFQEREQTRRDRLEEQFSPELRCEVHLEALRYLKFFDNLSLYICLCSPYSSDRHRFSWLDPKVFAYTPTGQHFELHWLDMNTLQFRPFPFAQEFSVSLPVYRHRQSSWSTQEAFEKDWPLRERHWRRVVFT